VHLLRLDVSLGTKQRLDLCDVWCKELDLSRRGLSVTQWLSIVQGAIGDNEGCMMRVIVP
jgi:hypothetical protein